MWSTNNDRVISAILSHQEHAGKSKILVGKQNDWLKKKQNKTQETLEAPFPFLREDAMFESKEQKKNNKTDK